MAPRRVFLGWDGPLLPRAAEWIVAELGTDLRDVVVALPGARAARRLLELLARRAPPDWTPPRVLTQGELTDELVLVDRPVASRLVRTLAWERALRGLARRDVAAVTAEILPDDGGPDGRAWTRLAAAVRGVHGELAPQGLVFGDVERVLRKSGRGGEATRWSALARAQERWRAILDEAKLADPHEARFDAIRAGRVDCTKRIVLVGVADANQLLRHTLELCADRTTALVFAPGERANDFDELGCLRVDAWSRAHVPIALDRWRVAGGPADQAEEAVAALAEWGGRFAASEVSIGVADGEVTPHLVRRLAREGVTAHDAAGVELARTSVARLVDAAGEHCRERTYRTAAALARHPDVEHVLAANVERVNAATDERVLDRDPSRAREPAAAVLDRFHADHLPVAWPPERLVQAPLVDEDKTPRRAQRPEPVFALSRALDAWLGALATPERRPLVAWTSEIRAWLERTYGDALLAPRENEHDRMLAGALAATSDALDEIAALPAPLASRHATSCEAFELLHELAYGSANARLAPRPVRAGESAVELLGWLELHLDDGPALVVTGFNEGRVPRSAGHDPFLPDALRKELGLASDADRIARDAYVATVLCGAREELLFVSGRRGAEGDPLLPSRLALRRPQAELVERTQRFVAGGATRAIGPDMSSSRAPAPRALPRLATIPVPTELGVTALGNYLRSPYAFYLDVLLGLEAVDDRARELDGRGFGVLAHDVLDDFARSKRHADSVDAAAIEAFLRERLDLRARERFGERAAPAVRLQVLQLGRRLALFARWQARRRADGWRIAHSEWTPSERVALDVDGAPFVLKGRIDRIDKRELGRGRVEWALLDYKTGDRAQTPEQTHRKRKRWVALQLPLYTLLARELFEERPAELGYVMLGQDERHTGLLLATWSDDELYEAVEAAKDAIRRIRAGDLFELGPAYPDDVAHRAIAGLGFLTSSPDDAGDGANGDESSGDAGAERA